MPDDEVVDSSSTEESPEVADQEPEGEELASAETTEESAPSDEESSEPVEGESAAAPEAARSSVKRGNADTRIKKLTARNRELERELQQFRQGQQETQKPAALEPPKKPKLADYDDLSLYEKDVEKYGTDVEAYAAAKVERDRQEKAAAEAKAKAEGTAREAWEKKLQDTLKRRPDFDVESAIAEVRPSVVMNGFFVRSKIGPDILAYLQDNPDEADRIRVIQDPFEAHEELLGIQAQLSERIHGKQKSAPKVPSYVRGAGSSPARERSAEDVLYR